MDSVSKLLGALCILLCATVAVGQEPTSDTGFQGVVQAQAPSIAETVLFYIFAALVLISSLGVAISQNIVRTALWLLATLCGVAGLYFLMAANLLGALQLIIYAGGTMVLIVFGVMLTSKSPWVRFKPRLIEVIGGVVVCGVLFTLIVKMVSRTTWVGLNDAPAGTPVADFGKELLTTYLAPFEVVSVLLLVVMIGAAFMARQERRRK